MKAVELVGTGGYGDLRMVERTDPSPGPGEVVVRISAASLNYRDLVIANGNYGAFDLPVVPLSDGVGEVVEVGAKAKRFKVGDRLCPHYVVDWLSGPATPAAVRRRLGGPDDGVLCEYFCGHESAFVSAPSHMTDAQCATLPIAGLTAWQALFEVDRVGPGDWVVVQGTGGVSIFALQLAKAAGAQVIVTSSSDDKLDRARALGADVTVNYRRESWDEAVLEVTQGEGANHVLEVVGGENLTRSVRATRMGGTVSLIGFLEDGRGSIDLRDAFRLMVRMVGISVANRMSFEALVRACEANEIRPAIDRTFSFEQAALGYEWLQAGSHFGKVTIALED